MGRSIIDFIRWSGEDKVLAYRHPKCNISKYAKLQVSEAQEAVVIVNGNRSQKFGTGTYNLDSPNIPILRSFYGIPFGGENPWTVQAWFVNKVLSARFPWKIDDFLIYDETLQVTLPIAAEGRFGVTVDDAERFIFQLALGAASDPDSEVNYTVDKFLDHIMGELAATSKSLISKIIQDNRYGINQMSRYLVDISRILESSLAPFFEKYGCRIFNFYVDKIDIDTSTESGRRAKNALDQQTEQKISGHTWQQGRMFETAQQAMNNPSGGGLLGAVMFAGMMGGGMGTNSKMAEGTMNPSYDQPSPSPVNSKPADLSSMAPVKEVYCSKCSRKFTSDNRFCPHCGNRYNPCPKCGTDNDESSTRCVSCGVSLASSASGNNCPNCNTVIAPGMAFCPGCGRPVGENKCPRCGTAIKGTAFCPSCGMKIK